MLKIFVANFDERTTTTYAYKKFSFDELPKLQT